VLNRHGQIFIEVRISSRDQCVFDALSGGVALVAVLAWALAPHDAQKFLVSSRCNSATSIMSAMTALTAVLSTGVETPPWPASRRRRPALTPIRAFNNAAYLEPSARAIAAIKSHPVGQSSPPGRFRLFNHRIHVNKAGLLTCPRQITKSRWCSRPTLADARCVEFIATRSGFSARKISFNMMEGPDNQRKSCPS